VSRDQNPSRQAILSATEALLAERSFAELRVRDILDEAKVAQATFYVYFESRHALLATLARNAFEQMTADSWPWADHDDSRPARESIEHAVRMGAALWRDHGPVMRAMAENWSSDPVLAELWHGQMESIISRTAERIEEGHASGVTRTTWADPRLLAALLTWMGERVHYLASLKYAPFDDEEQFIQGLVEVWHSVFFSGRPEDDRSPRPATETPPPS
jgi:AcrR family transcriptional regulator